MNIIYKDEQESAQLIDQLADRVTEKVMIRLEGYFNHVLGAINLQDEWVELEEAKRILKVKGSRKMQEIRNNSPMNGVIISKDGNKIIYNRASLKEYIDRKIRKG